MNKLQGILAATTMAFTAGSAFANDIGYSWIDVTAFNNDIASEAPAAKHSSYNGVAVAGSYKVASRWFVSGRYEDGSLQSSSGAGIGPNAADEDYTRSSLGVSYIYPWGDENTKQFDVILGVSGEAISAERLAVNDRGASASIGFRARVADDIELNGGGSYLSVGDADGFAFNVGILLEVSKYVGILAEYRDENLDQDQDHSFDLDGARIGFRILLD